MTFETKFDISDVVYFLNDNKITSKEVTAIKIFQEGKTLRIVYILGSYTERNEKLLFATKEKLIDFLLK